MNFLNIDFSAFNFFKLLRIQVGFFFSLKYKGYSSSEPLIHLPNVHFNDANQLTSSVDFQLKMVIWLKKDGLGETPAFLILMTSNLELCRWKCPLEIGHTTASKSKEPMCTYISWVHGKPFHKDSRLGATFKRSALYWFHGCLVIQLESLWLYLSIRLRKICLRRYPTKFSLVGTIKVQPSQLIDSQETDQ